MAASVKMLPALYTTLSSLNRIRNGQASLETIRHDLPGQGRETDQRGRDRAAAAGDDAEPARSLCASASSSST